MNAYKPRKTPNTSEAFGRKRGSWFQQRSISVHNSVIQIGWVGRGGRVPFDMAIIAAEVELSPNGTAPVNTYIVTERQ